MTQSEIQPAQNGARDGRLTFARYAFMPNSLGYCGGPQDKELLDYAVEDAADDGMNHLIRQFQAAWPNLVFIAEASGIGDPFDSRVVEAYWVGNDVLRRVEPVDFHEYLTEKIARRIPKRLHKYIAGKVPAGARPHHSFHVFDVGTRTGLLETNIDTMDRCRIAWGVVESIAGDMVHVRYEPVVLSEGNLALGEPVTREARRTAEGQSYLKDLKAGEAVSLHWDWVCDRLSPSQVARLSSETAHHIRIANQTL